MAGRNVFASDLSPYAFVLSRAKTEPPSNLEVALKGLDRYWALACKEKRQVDLRQVPMWVRDFFHRETLRETIAIRNVLLRHRQLFLLSCLLGILHHWRNGFLSYPCSHTVPHLKNKLYSRAQYPELYEYREVYARLRAKVIRAFEKTANVDRGLVRRVKRANALSSDWLAQIGTVSAIITSPPYMNSLSYARDNRLRLWFLGVEDHRLLEPRLSPRKPEFHNMMRKLLVAWSKVLVKEGPCILVLGAVQREGRYHDLPSEILKMAKEVGCGWRETGMCQNPIPDSRRVRLNCQSTRLETILVLRRGGR